MKKILVRLRKFRRMLFLSEAEFDREYFVRRVRDISDEINHMPLKERLQFVSSLRKNVVNNLIKEQAIAKLTYEAIKLELKDEQTE